MFVTRTFRLAQGLGKTLKSFNKLQPLPNGVRCLATATTPGDIVGVSTPDKESTYTEQDSILYNIGVGASLESGNPGALRFLWENDPNFSVLPSFGTLFINSFLKSIYKDFPLQFDFSKLFHGEHYLEVIRPLDPKGGKLITKSTVKDVVDKGKGTVIVIEVNTNDDKGNHMIRNQTVVFTTQFGKWGGKRSSDMIQQSHRTPDRAPDISITDQTSLNQAALYRLTGDNNPFHIDPSFAVRGGFDRPILHGLCSYGFSIRNVIEQFCDNDVNKFKSSKLRFSSPVLPGHSIRTDMWKEASRIHFVTTNVDTGKVAISGGHVDLKE